MCSSLENTGRIFCLFVLLFQLSMFVGTFIVNCSTNHPPLGIGRCALAGSLFRPSRSTLRLARLSRFALPS